MTPEQIDEALKLVEQYCRPTGEPLVADIIEALVAELKRARELLGAVRDFFALLDKTNATLPGDEIEAFLQGGE